MENGNRNARAGAPVPILVTGGTGTLGRLVVEKLQNAGCDVRVLSRHRKEDQPGVQYFTADLATGIGTEAAVAGCGIVIHCAGTSKGDDDKARMLVDAASKVEVRHLIFISVVGADQVPQESFIDRLLFGYFGSKHRAEKVIEQSGIPWTTLRATQFHDLFLITARQMTKLLIIPVPNKFRFQPIDTEEVAERLVELAFGEPSGLVADIAGPRIYEMQELLQSYINAAKIRRWFLPIRLPGKAAEAVRGGVILSPDRAVGRRTWEKFLEKTFGNSFS